MTIREARKEQLKSIKNRSAKEKFSYFWEYYGIKSICLLFALIAVIAFIISMVTKKDYAVTAVFFGGVAQDGAEDYLCAFGEKAGIDPNQYEISVQCRTDVKMDQQMTQDTYLAMESFTAMVSAKTVDCFSGHDSLFLYYAYMEYATDLRTVFTPEELELLSPYLHYIDGELIRQQEANDEGLADAYSRRQDSTKPELMTDPIPVGISLRAATEEFKNAYLFGDNTVIGICAGTERTQHTIAFLRHILGM